MFSRSAAMQSHGNSTQVFETECAALVLLKLDENRTLRLLRFGEFAVNMIYQTTNNILMSTCQVQDLEWPIAKDAPIIRVGRRSFTFALPGLLYGVQFPPPCKDSCMDILEKVFLKYSDYCNLLCEGTQASYPYPDNDMNFWANVRPQVEGICFSKLIRLDNLLGRSPFPGGNNVDSGDLSRVVRTGKTTQFVANAILTGSLKSAHIVVIDNRRGMDQAKRIQVAESKEAFASIEVVTSIVEALETNRMAATEENSSHESAAEQRTKLVAIRPRRSAFKHWKLTEAGMSIFLQNPTKRSSGSGEKAGREAR